MTETSKNNDFIIILFYKFVDMADPKAFVLEHKQKCTELGIVGRMLVAEEGINGTFEGTREKIDEYVRFLKSDPRFADIIIKESKGNGIAFPKLKIKVRPEVVTLGAGRFNVKEETAPEISVSELKKLYESNEDFVVLDLRNDYEIASGKFDKTLDPGLANFRDLPTKLAELKEVKDLKNKKIVTVCTGGIRCEKATCLMKREGFENIYQLKDGIHTYMKEYPGQDFKGSLFVFDNRLTTDVVPTENKEVIGKCKFCENRTETYYSDDRTRPSRKVLCCDSCYLLNKQYLREGVTKVEKNK
jgi:UPF0176 protein